MAYEDFHVPATADEFLAQVDAAYERQDAEELQAEAEAETILGSKQDINSARGRLNLLAELISRNPEGNFNVAIPMVSLRGDTDQPLPHEARMRAMAVNEYVFYALLEENNVDLRQATLNGEVRIGGHIMREIAYPSDKGYVFVESKTFGYGENPMTALPTHLSVDVYSLRDGLPVGGIDLTPPPAANSIEL